MRPICVCVCEFVRALVRAPRRLSSRGCGGVEGLAAEGARVPESLQPAEAVREHVQ